jgi:hypothetical protein
MTRRAISARPYTWDDFASNECVWRETGNALKASATTDGRGATLTRALDPDGRGLNSSTFTTQLNLSRFEYLNHPIFPQKVLSLSLKVDECYTRPLLSST